MSSNAQVRRRAVQAARGESPFDLLLIDARIIHAILRAASSSGRRHDFAQISLRHEEANRSVGFPPANKPGHHTAGHQPTGHHSPLRAMDKEQRTTEQ